MINYKYRHTERLSEVALCSPKVRNSGALHVVGIPTTINPATMGRVDGNCSAATCGGPKVVILFFHITYEKSRSCIDLMKVKASTNLATVSVRETRVWNAF